MQSPFRLNGTQLDMQPRYKERSREAQVPMLSPSTSISLGLGPVDQVKCESGLVAGPCRSAPSSANSDPWHGHTKCLLPLSYAYEQPRGDTLIASARAVPLA